MKLKLASWNINSVRARADIVGRLLDEEQPDILCLQETKAMDAVFPAALFHSRGYVHHEPEQKSSRPSASKRVRLEADVLRMIELVYDELGPAVARRWFKEYPARYGAAFYESSRIPLTTYVPKAEGAPRPTDRGATT